MDKLFITKELAKEINNIDIEFTRLNARKSLVFENGMCEKQFGRTVAFRKVNQPEDEYYNRVVGFTEEDLPYLDEILNWYSEFPTKCIITLPPYSYQSKILEAFRERGIEYNGLDSIFCQIPKRITIEKKPNLDFELITEESFETLVRLMEEGGRTINNELKRKIGFLHYDPCFQFYIARVDGVPASTGSLFLHQGIGWLSNAYTLESYRGRGCQSLLLQARIDAGAKAGCKLLLVDTEFGSKSHYNILNTGFQLAYNTAEMIKR